MVYVFSKLFSMRSNFTSIMSQEQLESKQSITKLSEEMTSLSQQVSQLSKELQEMTRLLRPLLVMGAQPLLTALSPTMPPSPSSRSGPTISTPPAPSPTASPSAPLRPTRSLLDSADTGSIGLPSCLIPTSPPLRPHAQVQVSPAGCSRGPSLPVLISPVTTQTEGPVTRASPTQPLQTSQPPSPSLTFSFSLPSFRSQSSSCSPCQGPHRPASHSRGLLPRPPSLDTPIPPHSHCSAPPSINNSPGDHRVGISPFPSSSSSSAPRVQPRACTPPSCPHNTPPLPCSMDSLAENQASFGMSWSPQNPIPGPPQLEIEMQEWAATTGRPTTEHISFIDEEGPPL